MPGVGGHTALFAIEQDGDPSGTFTVVPGITSAIPHPMSRNSSTEVPHGDTINTSIVGPMMSGPITISGHHRYNHATHDWSTGLGKRFNDGDLMGFQVRGPNWAAGVDEVIGSGYVTNFERSAENDAGFYNFTATIQPTGPVKVNGTVIGTQL